MLYKKGNKRQKKKKEGRKKKKDSKELTAVVTRGNTAGEQYTNYFRAIFSGGKNPPEY